MASPLALKKKTPPAGLKRTIGLRDLALFYVSSSLSVRWIAMAAAVGPSTLIVWLAALLCFFVPLAACVMELSSRYPEEGGLYVWSRAGLGDFSGFIAAWTYWMSNLSYFPGVLYFAAGSVLFGLGARGEALAASPRYYVGFAVIALALITLLNILGMNAGKWLNNAGALGSMAPLAAVILLGGVSYWRFGAGIKLSAASFLPHWTLKDALFWATIFMGYTGVEAGSAMGDEIRNPRRVIPWAILIAGAVLGIGYIAGTAALLVELPGQAVSGPDGFVNGFRALSAKVGLGWLLAPMALLVGLNGVGGASAYLSSTSRLPFVAGIDRYLPAAFGRVRPRFGTPWVALGIYGLAGMAMALLGQAGTTVRGAYDVLVSMTVLATFLPFLFVFAAMMRVQSLPVSTEVRRVPGGKPMAIMLASLGMASTLFTVALSMIPGADEPHPLLVVLKVVGGTAVMVGAGVFVFATARQKVRREQEIGSGDDLQAPELPV